MIKLPINIKVRYTNTYNGDIRTIDYNKDILKKSDECVELKTDDIRPCENWGRLKPEQIEEIGEIANSVLIFLTETLACDHNHYINMYCNIPSSTAGSDIDNRIENQCNRDGDREGKCIITVDKIWCNGRLFWDKDVEDSGYSLFMLTDEEREIYWEREDNK